MQKQRLLNAVRRSEEKIKTLYEEIEEIKNAEALPYVPDMSLLNILTSYIPTLKQTKKRKRNISPAQPSQAALTAVEQRRAMAPSNLKRDILTRINGTGATAATNRKLSGWETVTGIRIPQSRNGVNNYMRRLMNAGYNVNRYKNFRPAPVRTQT